MVTGMRHTIIVLTVNMYSTWTDFFKEEKSAKHVFPKSIEGALFPCLCLSVFREELQNIQYKRCFKSFNPFLLAVSCREQCLWSRLYLIQCTSTLFLNRLESSGQPPSTAKVGSTLAHIDIYVSYTSQSSVPKLHGQRRALHIVNYKTGILINISHKFK